MRSIICLLAASLFLLSSPPPSPAQNDRNLERPKAAGVAEKRVALVIGNAAYTKAKPLANPANDAADMAKALKDVGFEVFSGVDLDKRRMETLIREFGARLANGGTGLFYYAGHGIQVGGENYLVPVDADIPEEDEVSYSAIPVGLVLSKMSKANNDLNIVILDACRNNPFARSWRGYRDAGNADGLAKISPPTGTLVLYATEPGKVASDGTGRNGLFTESLLKQIKKPNVEYDQMVKAVSADVWQKSNKLQLPWKEGNSLADFYFAGGARMSLTATPDKMTVGPKVIFEERFDDNSRDWFQSNEKTGSIESVGNAYLISSKTGWLYSTQKVDVRMDGNFSIETKARKLAGVDNYGYGLIWGLKDKENYYSMLLFRDGAFGVIKATGGQISWLIPDTNTTSAFKVGSTNTIKVEKVENRLRFYINDLYVGNLPFEPFFGNRVGFIVFNTQTIEFDDLIITRD